MGESSGIIIPGSVMEAVKRTSDNIEEVRTQFLQFLSLCDTDVLSEMQPLQRAQSLLLLAKATTTLFTLRLRCGGINLDDHPVKSELERLSLYQEKLDKCIHLSKAPLQPSATINTQAAARFIEHSLPDLTPEQRKGMREISRGEWANSKYLESSVRKKRKCLSSGKQSVQTAAQEFLEKASRELLGDKGGFKEPILIEDSDNENSEFEAPILIEDSGDDDLPVG